ncbi:hypothetical protein ACIOEW_38150 [Streptomyces sp. NPDC087901]
MAESALRGALATRYKTVRPFLSLLGESMAGRARLASQAVPLRTRF